MAEEVKTGVPEGTDNNGGTETKTYTTEQINQMMEEARKEERAAAEKKAEEHYQKKQKEAEKLRGMSAEDKREYELQQRETAIAEKELELARAENKAECLSLLADKGLDTKLVDLVLSDEAETMYNNIKLLEKAFKASVKAEVEKRIGTSSPKKSAAADENMTKASLMKMSIGEIQRFKQENPSTFDSLMAN